MCDVSIALNVESTPIAISLGVPPGPGKSSLLSLAQERDNQGSIPTIFNAFDAVFASTGKYPSLATNC